MPNDRDNMVEYLQKLVDKLKAAELRIKELENEMAITKADKTRLETVEIPDYMSEQQTNQVGLLSGQVVTVKPFYYARVPENPVPFFEWLKANGHGGIIKDKFEVFPSTPEKAAYLELFLSHEIGPMYERSTNIHWKTLEAWFKEQCENRASLPLQLFNNFVGRKATVK